MTEPYSVPERPGVLPQQHLQALAAAGHLRASIPFEERQFQPASMDLRLGDTAHMLVASFLPNGRMLAERLPHLRIGRPLDLTDPQGAVLLPGRTYLVPLIESLRLPSGVRGYASPRSSTGRLDVFVRLLADRGTAFDEVPDGYEGPLWAEITSQTFTVAVRSGLALTQLRLVTGDPTLRPLELEAVHEDEGVLFTGPRRERAPAIDVDSRGVQLRVSLSHGGPFVGWRSRQFAPLLDMGAVHTYDPLDFFEPIRHSGRDGVILEPGCFHLFLSSDYVRVPPATSANMAAYDVSIAEARPHAAGYVDSGWGYGGEAPGTRLVLEVRAHDIPFLIEDEQPIARLVYERVVERPAHLYGDETVGSHFQDQAIALSRQFKPYES